VDDWLEYGLSGRSARTVQLYRDAVKPLMSRLGTRPLRNLSAADVRSGLAGLGEDLSTRSLQIAHNCLVRAIRLVFVPPGIANLHPPLVRSGIAKRCHFGWKSRNFA
jgi:hypothetical protein